MSSGNRFSSSLTQFGSQPPWQTPVAESHQMVRPKGDATVAGLTGTEPRELRTGLWGPIERSDLYLYALRVRLPPILRSAVPRLDSAWFASFPRPAKRSNPQHKSAD